MMLSALSFNSGVLSKFFLTFDDSYKQDWSGVLKLNPHVSQTTSSRFCVTHWPCISYYKYESVVVNPHILFVFLEGLTNTTKNIYTCSMPQDRDMNLRHPEYEVTALGVAT
jgi:hypothetical protein